jgi:hypothetical protein
MKLKLKQLFCKHNQFYIGEYDKEATHITCSLCGKQFEKHTIKTCHYCYYRHRCPYEFCYYGCRHWRLGQCLLCKNLNASDDDWFKRGCEAKCYGGCREHFKRNWKATFKWIFTKNVDKEG